MNGQALGMAAGAGFFLCLVLVLLWVEVSSWKGEDRRAMDQWAASVRAYQVWDMRTGWTLGRFDAGTGFGHSLRCILWEAALGARRRMGLEGPKGEVLHSFKEKEGSE